ncbi:MAG: endo-1,3-alpha-glucanase family glycosylhydrolase, partial [Nitrospirota bacterium]
MLLALILAGCINAAQVPSMSASQTHSDVTETHYPATPTPTPTDTPTSTPIPPVEISYYHLRFVYSSTSDWADIEFLEPQRLVSVRVLSIVGTPQTANADLPFFRLYRPVSDLYQEPEVSMSVDVAILPEDVAEPLEVQSQHGAIGGSGLEVYYVAEDTMIKISEFNHYWVDSQHPDTSLRKFSIDLQELGNYQPAMTTIQVTSNEKMVWAVYYPWIAWDLEADCTDHPAVPYVYSRPEVLSRDTIEGQIELAKSAGIDGFMVSWFDDPISDENLRLLLEAAEEQDFKITIYMEILLDGDLNPSIESWIEHAVQWYGDHPAYMQFEGKPLIVIYSSEIAPNSTWEEIFGRLEEKGVYASYLGSGYNLSNFDTFIGVHQYVVLGTPGLPQIYQTISQATRYYSIFQDDSTTKKIFVATVHPGFNDCPYGGDSVYTRDDGNFYREMWQTAIESDPDWIMITSWNEFGESTHIEPSEFFGTVYL